LPCLGPGSSWRELRRAAGERTHELRGVWGIFAVLVDLLLSGSSALCDACSGASMGFMSAFSRGLAFALLASLAALGQKGSGGERGAAGASRADAQDLGATFTHQCGRCHVPPDPAFAVDRAWLEQVHDTA
jgi:hypothetical protein